MAKFQNSQSLNFLKLVFTEDTRLSKLYQSITLVAIIFKITLTG